MTDTKPLLLTQGLINSRGPFDLAVDTGASMTVISRRVARRARVATSEGKNGMAVSVAGRSEVSFGKLALLEIGAVQAVDVDVAIMTLTPVSRAIRTRLDGILGHNFLQDYRVTIDYAAQRLYLTDPTSALSRDELGL